MLVGTHTKSRAQNPTDSCKLPIGPFVNDRRTFQHLLRMLRIGGYFYFMHTVLLRSITHQLVLKFQVLRRQLLLKHSSRPSYLAATISIEDNFLLNARHDGGCREFWIFALFTKTNDPTYLGTYLPAVLQGPCVNLARCVDGLTYSRLLALLSIRVLRAIDSWGSLLRGAVRASRALEKQAEENARRIRKVLLEWIFHKIRLKEPLCGLFTMGEPIEPVPSRNLLGFVLF